MAVVLFTMGHTWDVVVVCIVDVCVCCNDVVCNICLRVVVCMIVCLCVCCSVVVLPGCCCVVW